MSLDTHSGSDPTATESATALLKCENLAVSYGKVNALRGVDITVNQGEIVGVIGPNGAGKTTLSETVTGLLGYSGSVTYDGMEISDFAAPDLVAEGIIHCTESRDLFGYMSVDDNLRLGAYRNRSMLKDRLAFVYDLFPALKDRKSQHARTMSGGEQQMLAIGRALMGDPDFLVLDEPTLGLAPVILNNISDGIDRLQEQGLTMLLCEQNVRFTIRHADRIYLMENGDIVREGTPETLKDDEYIQEVYLGA
ncbi:ABC transporter ATP-binding protein [Haladaptatus sp. ZSTT2]|uniref:ABC transporter ATP-binding protein n=1 Tax=Haladaptatus sp. ZSTT2 TaxID=3120515 RepID=UPI00300EF107